MDDEIYVKLLEGYQAFPSAVGKLNKEIYGLVQARTYFDEADRRSTRNGVRIISKLAPACSEE